MTAKPVLEQISDERLAVRPTEDITTRLDNLAQSLAGEYPPHTLMDLAEAASLIATMRTELQHRREAEAGALPADDNALAQMCEDFQQGSVAFANDPDEFHHLIEFTPPQLREFIATRVRAASPSSPASGVRVIEELERQTENLSFILNRVGEDVLHQWHGKFDRELREAQALLSALGEHP